MTSPVVPLLGSNLRSWLSAKGFWLVVASALLPLVLTGAWVGTHRADVTASGLQVPETMMDGESVTFRATITNGGSNTPGPFNATLAVGTVSGGFLNALGQETTTIEGLEPGTSREITLTWNATAGTLFVVAFADQEDVLPEIDEYDNQDALPIAVGYGTESAGEAPTAPASAAGNETANATVDLGISALRRPASSKPGDATTLEADVVNLGAAPVTGANVTLLVGRSFGPGGLFPASQTTATLDLAPGESKTVTLAWTAVEGAWWQQAWVDPPAETKDSSPDDNHKAETFSVDPTIPADFKAPDIPDKLTIKEFYLQILTLLHFRVLLPLIALFYAAGVIADEREKGSLPYLLTRPIPRWTIPITKFAASFVVASLAAIAGLVLTYALLFGTTPEGGDIGFLTTPILEALLTLFVYGALFTLLGIWVERPYLIGVAFVLGWENIANIFVPQVRNFTITQHIRNAVAAWPLDEGLQWTPTGEQGMRALLLLLAAGAIMLVVATGEMKRREFEV